MNRTSTATKLAVPSRRDERPEPARTRARRRLVVRHDHRLRWSCRCGAVGTPMSFLMSVQRGSAAAPPSRRGRRRARRAPWRGCWRGNATGPCSDCPSGGDAPRRDAPGPKTRGSPRAERRAAGRCGAGATGPAGSARSVISIARHTGHEDRLRPIQHRDHQHAPGERHPAAKRLRLSGHRQACLSKLVPAATEPAVCYPRPAPLMGPPAPPAPRHRPADSRLARTASFRSSAASGWSGAGATGWRRTRSHGKPKGHHSVLGPGAPAAVVVVDLGSRLPLGASSHDRWGWASGAGAMALVSYLITPSEFPPRYGLDHEFAVEDEEFLPTMAGATGVPLLPGNRIDILNNGDAFYPAMLEAIEDARALDHHRGLHLLGRRHRPTVRASALAAKARGRRAGQDPARRRRLGDASATRSSRSSRRGRCQLAWYNPIRWYTLGRFNHRTHRKSLIVDGRDRVHRRRRHRRSLARATRGPERLARHADPDRGAGGHAAADRLRAELAADDRRADLGAAVLPGRSTRAGAAGGADDHELAGDRRVHGADRCTTCRSSARARSIYIANPYFVPDAAAIDALIEAKRRGVDVRIMVSGIHNDNWLARHNSVAALRTAAARAASRSSNTTARCCTTRRWWWTACGRRSGTTNFDNRSFAHNEENNVCCYDRDFACGLHDDVRGRHGRLRPGHAGGLEAARPGAARAGARRRVPRRTDVALQSSRPELRRESSYLFVNSESKATPPCSITCSDTCLAGDAGRAATR